MRSEPGRPPAPAPPAAGPPAPGPMVPVVHRVVARRVDLDDTVTLSLMAERPGSPGGEPGQFNMLWAPGIGEVPISLAGGDDGVIIHTVRRVGAVSAALAACGVGDVIGVRGPFGIGWDLGRARGRDVLVVAGGLGLAPVRPVVLALLADRGAFDRVVVAVGARSPDRLIYPDELEAWRAQLGVEVTVDSATPPWRGHVGVVTRLVERARLDPARATVFVCGPEVMMRFVALAAIDRGVPAAEIQVSLERNMRCAIGHCGHCQLGPAFLCKDGPVMTWSRAAPLLTVRGL